MGRGLEMQFAQESASRIALILYLTENPFV
jgi:hypothetical protein